MRPINDPAQVAELHAVAVACPATRGGCAFGSDCLGLGYCKRRVSRGDSFLPTDGGEYGGGSM